MHGATSESDSTRASPQRVRRQSFNHARGATARALRHTQSPQRVPGRALRFARRHGESDPTRAISADGSTASLEICSKVQKRERFNARIFTEASSAKFQSRAQRHSESNATHTIPAEGSSASFEICTAPLRERSDTHNLRTGFISELGDLHGTARAIRRAHLRRGFVRKASNTRAAPQRERCDTHTHTIPGGVFGHILGGHTTRDLEKNVSLTLRAFTAKWLQRCVFTFFMLFHGHLAFFHGFFTLFHGQCGPCRIFTAKSFFTSKWLFGLGPPKMRSNAPVGLRRGFIGELCDFARRHSESDSTRTSPQRVCRRSCNWRHSESDARRTISADGSSAKLQILTAPQRARSDPHDPRRGFVGELSDSHGATARAIRHAQSPQRVRGEVANSHGATCSESDSTCRISAEGSSASFEIRTPPQRERCDTHSLRRGLVVARRHSESDSTRAVSAEGSSTKPQIRTA